ncbi:MAG: GGDEF domain-containing protein [bacterium]|nr:GGDEF domain-containing protein [bacterium]
MKAAEKYQGEICALMEKGGATSIPHARTMITAQLLLSRADARLDRAREEAERYRGLAEKDPLTGLLRRENYMPILDHARQKFLLDDTRTHLFLMQLDIDLFSWVNDVFECHFFGDLTLQTIGDIIRRYTRIGDFAVRKGGEEFVIMPEYSDGKTGEIHGFAERLIGNIETDLLRTTVETMVNGKRTCKVRRNSIEEEEREGSIALGEFARGMVALKTQEEKREHFLDHAKGGREAKGKLLERISALDITGYQEHIDDQRTWEELSDDDRQRRFKCERKIGEAAIFVFEQITCSAGVLCLTPADKETTPSAVELDAMTDKLVYKAKLKGGNRVVVKLGLNGG